MIRLKPAALASLRNRLTDRGLRPSIVMPADAKTTADELLGEALTSEYGPFCDAMYMTMAADRKIDGAERDVIRGALRELDDRIRSSHIESMLAASQHALESEGRARRLQVIGEALTDERPRAEAAFLLAAAVAYADNEIAPEENEVLQELTRALGIDLSRAHELFNGSLEQVDAVIGGNANADAADLTLHAAMRLRTPEDFERLAATTDRPDVTLMLRLFASFARTGEEMRDRATETPRSLASARAQAVQNLAETIPEGRSPHIDSVRFAIAQLGEALRSVDSVPALRSLVAQDVPQPPIVTLEQALSRLSQITADALRR